MFFYLADTGWELFHKLDKRQALQYLINRKEKGFNVIQAVILPELGPFNSPNAYGKQPMVSAESGYIPLEINSDTAYDYWDHVDFIVHLADSLGMYMALLPCWGEYVTPRYWKVPIFSSPNQGYAYGYYLGRRFASYKKIIWVLGGDRIPNEWAHGISTWNAMAEGITDGVSGKQGLDGDANWESTFMAYHCFYPSDIWFHNQPWLDVTFWGSYHEKKDNDRAYEIPYYQYAKPAGVLPTINAEPPYELGSVNYDPDGKYGRFDAFDVRQQAYWSVFSGCAGHTYGCDLIWQFTDRISTEANTSNTWESQLQVQGASQMQYVHKLVKHVPWITGKPAQHILYVNTHDPKGHLQAYKGAHFAVVYNPVGKPVDIVAESLHSDNIVYAWYDPETGVFSKKKPVNFDTVLHFVPPVPNKDWVLCIYF